jgi:predicted nucleic acid-binding protein
MFLFDTDFLSHFTKRRPSPPLLEKFASVPPEARFITTITVSEIYFGAFRVDHGPAILETYETRIFPNLTILPFDLESARISGRIRARLEKIGRVTGSADLFIAAIALRHGLTLVTGNTKHFAGIPRLRVENWIAPYLSYKGKIRNPAEEVSDEHQKKNSRFGCGPVLGGSRTGAALQRTNIERDLPLSRDFSRSGRLVPGRIAAPAPRPGGHPRFVYRHMAVCRRGGVLRGQAEKRLRPQGI